MQAHQTDLTLNLGSAQGHSVLEVLRTTEQILGRPLNHAFAARREGDPARLVASAAQARALLNWSPQHSSLETLIESSWRVYQA